MLILYAFSILGAFVAVLRTRRRFLLCSLRLDFAHNLVKLSLFILRPIHYRIVRLGVRVA